MVIRSYPLVVSSVTFKENVGKIVMMEQVYVSLFYASGAEFYTHIEKEPRVKEDF